MHKLQQLLKEKQTGEDKLKQLATLNFSSILTEKERLQKDLDGALDQIDKLRKLLADNTLNTLFTVPDVRNDDISICQI